MESLCFDPRHDQHCHYPSTKYASFLCTPLWSTSPSPTECRSLFFLSRGEVGERCIDVTGSTSEEEREGSINPSSFVFSPRVCFHLFIWVSESVGISIQYWTLPRVWSAPYDCKLRVNFHCWLRLGLQTSTVSPPILALRLSRQRLLPTWRSFELDSICSHFCLLSFSRQPCSLMREPAVLSTTVRHKSMCLTDLSLVRAHSWFPPALWHS